jgi:hypothetical protein
MATLKEEVELTGASLLKRLRLATHPPGKKAICLQDLSDRQLSEVYNRLRLGQPLAHIARLIQKDWSVHRDFLQKSVERALSVFRDRVVPLLYQKPDKEPMKDRYKRGNQLKKATLISKDLDALGRLRWVIEEQTGRCLKWKELERAAPLTGATVDWKALADMCVKAVQLEIDLGVRDRAPSQHIVGHKVKFDQFLEDIGDDGAERLLSAADCFLTEIDSKLLTMEQSEDGTFNLRPATDAEKLSDMSMGICGGMKGDRGLKDDDE